MMLYIVFKFGEIRSSNPGNYSGRICNFSDARQKLAFGVTCLIKYWTDLTKFSDLVDLLVRMINLAFILRSSQGRCYCNQLNFWRQKYT